MAGQRKSRAFRRGFWLAGIASAGAVLWNAPQAGARTREQIREQIERVLFGLLDMTDRLSTVGGQDPEFVATSVPAANPGTLDPALTETEPVTIPG